MQLEDVIMKKGLSILTANLASLTPTLSLKGERRWG
jgi:hypothetical protein